MDGLWLATQDLKIAKDHLSRSRERLLHTRHRQAVAVNDLEKTVDALKHAKPPIPPLSMSDDNNGDGETKQ